MSVKDRYECQGNPVDTRMSVKDRYECQGDPIDTRMRVMDRYGDAIDPPHLVVNGMYSPPIRCAPDVKPA